MAFVRIEAGVDDATVRVTENAARARALERENNLLPWRIDILSETALEALDELLDQICRYPDRYSGDVLAGAYLLQASLVTGRSISTLVTLPIGMMEPSAINEETPSGLYRGRSEWAWWLKAGRPTSEQNLEEEAQPLYRVSCEKMLLWCGERTRHLFITATKTSSLRLKPKPAPPGASAAYDLTPKAGSAGWSTAAAGLLTSACLSKLPPSQRHALSTKRVKNWLFSKLVDDTGEPAIGAIVTDNVTTLSNAVVHYTWLPREEALERQHQLAGPYDTMIKDGVKPPLPTSKSLPGQLQLPDYGHGSRYVLKRSAVASFPKKLRPNARATFSSVEHIPPLILFHNQFTLYSFALIGFATGLRPGSDPIPHPRRIDPMSGFLVWNDKDRKVDARYRLLWLPEVAIHQIVRYHLHTETLKSLLTSFGIEGVGALDSVDDERESLFLLDPIKELRRANRKDVAEAFAKLNLPIRDNVWRHYLRTELAGHLPGDVLMAFLGHWQRGQDPWDVVSGLDPAIYRQALRQHLPPLLARDGWEPVWGLGKPPPQQAPLKPSDRVSLPLVR